MILRLFIIFWYISFFVSAINVDTIFISILLSFFTACLGLFYLFKNNIKIKFPRYFFLMLVFVAILQVYIFCVSDKLNPFYYAAIIEEGLIFWLIFYNLKQGYNILKSTLIYFSIFYSILYIANCAFGISLTKFGERIFRQDEPTRHYYLGILWALTIVASLETEVRKVKIRKWLFFLFGIIFIIVSGARSAYLSLALGIGYIFSHKKDLKKIGVWVSILVISIISGMFVIASSGRTTLFSRPYLLQSVQAFPKYPFGVGIGNFKIIENEFLQNGVSRDLLSIYTHNLFLETLSGIGIFSFLFLVFLVLIVKNLLTVGAKDVFLGAIVVVLLSNFMLDTSYTIPGFFWLLFISIGVFQSKTGLV